jgi:hypothetical protein
MATWVLPIGIVWRLLASKTQDPKKEETALQEEFSALVRSIHIFKAHPCHENQKGEN